MTDTSWDCGMDNFPPPTQTPEIPTEPEYRCEHCGRVTNTCKIYRFCGVCVS